MIEGTLWLVLLGVDGRGHQPKTETQENIPWIKMTEDGPFFNIVFEG